MAGEGEPTDNPKRGLAKRWATASRAINHGKFTRAEGTPSGDQSGPGSNKSPAQQAADSLAEARLDDSREEADSRYQDQMGEKETDKGE